MNKSDTKKERILEPVIVFSVKVKGEDNIGALESKKAENESKQAEAQSQAGELESSKSQLEQMVIDFNNQMESLAGELNELDTTGIEPMSHVFPVNNVFREDLVTNGDGSKATLANAPVQKDGGFKVPKTIGE